jgi:tetratricopeptide (TPR) repeat protein
VEAYQDAAARGGAPPATFHNLAVALERVGRYPEALSALQDAAKRGAGKDPRIQTSIGIVSLMMGDAAAADKAFTSSKHLWAGKPSVVWYLYASLAAALLGDTSRALQVLQESLLQHPHVASLHNNLAVMLEHRGSFDEALHTAERGLTDDPGLPQLHKNIGDLYFRAQRFDDALDSYERAVRSNPELGEDVYLKLGEIRMRRKERDEAVKCWELALQLDPHSNVAKTKLASARKRA